ncbi:MAG TPA: hypothetical protein VG742_03685 [Dongiaceae bacterium]|nr:hypothetical protein [Dongiaceae bacterium]
MNLMKPMLLCCSAGFLALVAPMAVSYGEGDPNQRIHALIEQLRSEPSLTTRYWLASDIAGIVRRTPDKTQIRDETVDEIVDLLPHDDGPVVMWLAAALGQFGQAAKRVVPELEVALERELIAEQALHTRTGPWPSDVICGALRNIDGAKRSGCLTP